MALSRGLGMGAGEDVIKLLMVGDSGVGKSSLLKVFVGEGFDDGVACPTVGMDFKVKSLNLDGQPCKVQIWDTAGQERFRTVIKQYYRGAKGILVVFDVCEQSSFDNVQHWLKEIEENSLSDTTSAIFLVGNKMEAEASRIVSRASSRRMAKKYGIEYMETSAKGDINVTEVFTKLAYCGHLRSLENVQSTSNNIRLSSSSSKPPKPSNSCC